MAGLFGGWKVRVALVILPLVAIVGGGWILATRWAPARSDYPVQGITVDSETGPLEWPTLRARHADFAYVRASSGDAIRDPAFAANWAGARAEGMRYGAIHEYSLCKSPVDQATLFMTTVPRDAGALPPVVRLRFGPDCNQRPNRDALLSDLNTFVNLIEGHAGKPALIRVSPDFEESYDVSGGVNRTLWLERNFLTPSYADRPWVIWTATDMRRLDGVDRPVEWDVVAP